MATLTSNGFPLDPSPECLDALRESTEALGDPAALRERMAEDGYLLLRGALDRDVVLAARRELLEKLAAAGDLDPAFPIDEAIPAAQATWSAELVRGLRTGPAVRALCHGGKMLAFFDAFFGEATRPLDHIWVRRVPPGAATGCHYDIVYMGRGTHELYTAWTPLGDVPFSDGPLAILENSHRLDELKSTYGQLDTDRDNDHPYVGGWLSKNAPAVQARYGGRWLTTEFRAGDILIFSMFTLHCSLDNASRRLRLSTDSRYQRASEPVDPRWVETP